jgi:hypothetical protein
VEGKGTGIDFFYILERYYQNKDNVKRYFDEFAASKGFDSLIPENWYSFTSADLKEVISSDCLQISCHV